MRAFHTFTPAWKVRVKEEREKRTSKKFFCERGHRRRKSRRWKIRGKYDERTSRAREKSFIFSITHFWRRRGVKKSRLVGKKGRLRPASYSSLKGVISFTSQLHSSSLFYPHSWPSFFAKREGKTVAKRPRKNRVSVFQSRSNFPIERAFSTSTQILGENSERSPGKGEN